MGEYCYYKGEKESRVSFDDVGWIPFISKKHEIK